MQIIARYIYNNLNNKNMNEYNRNIQLNKYCNCNSIKKYIPDNDAYGDWIICHKCNTWCGWYYRNEYYNRNGEKI